MVKNSVFHNFLGFGTFLHWKNIAACNYIKFYKTILL